MVGGRWSGAVVLALSLGGQGCGHSSDGPAAQQGGAPSAGAAGGALSAGGGGGAFSAGGGGGAFSAGGGAGRLGAGTAGAPPDGGADQADGVTVSLDFAPTLVIANETLLFPLEQTLHLASDSEPGELLVAYTRVGCWIDAEQLTRSAYGVGEADPVLLTTLTIAQELGSATAHSPNLDETCLTLRTPEGHWQAFLLPTNVSVSGTSAKFDFVMPAMRADAAAIFLPTYTAVSNITYTIRAP